MYVLVSILIISYLIGSIPFGYILTRYFRGMDVRHYGSHNIGTINVFRVGGLRAGVLTLVADVAKGAVPVSILCQIRLADWIIASAAMALLVGHAFSFWLFIRERRFSEGKCVATSLGVLIGLSLGGAIPWWVPAALLGFWVTGLLLPRLMFGRWWMISPVTMTAAAGISLAVWLASPAREYIVLGCAISVLILARHKNNIRRLLAGTEPRIGEKPHPPQAPRMVTGR